MISGHKAHPQSRFTKAAILLLVATATLLISTEAKAQEVPPQAAYIEANFNFRSAQTGKVVTRGVRCLGSVIDNNQTGVRWHFIIAAGFNVNYPTMVVPVDTWANVTLQDFTALANSAADAKTETINVIRYAEQQSHRAMFWPEK